MANHVMIYPEYRPLEASLTEIRLLVLHPAEADSAPLSAHFAYRYLEKAEKYEALSYTWGSLGGGGELMLDGVACTIFDNLEAALRRLRWTHLARMLWIDALCINQSDLDERAQQVKIMARIYDAAAHVLVWLGEETERSVLSFKLLRGGRQSSEVSNMWALTTELWAEDKTWGRLMPSKRSASVSAWKSQLWTDMLKERCDGEIRELLDRPYFQRSWTIQETVMARKISLLCGGEVIGWSAIEKYAEDSQSLSRTIDASQKICGIEPRPDTGFSTEAVAMITKYRKRWRSQDKDIPILDALWAFRWRQCTDSRDRIFAFLGLSRGIESLGIQPDYTIRVQAVYTQFAQLLIQATRTLDILNCCREWRGTQNSPNPTFAYSLVDQSRYHDIEASVYDQGGVARKGWARLPSAWERIKVGDTLYFRNNATGQVQQRSPLNGLRVQSQRVEEQRVCPEGWVKEWDNLGRCKLSYCNESQRALGNPTSTEFATLPTWVPNWAAAATLDPEPLLNWSKSGLYNASGGTLVTQDIGTNQSMLRLIGMVFDEIDEITAAWHPTSNNPPLWRGESHILASWETLAYRQRGESPYSGPFGLSDALWQTYMAKSSGNKYGNEWIRAIANVWYDATQWSQRKLDIGHFNRGFRYAIGIFGGDKKKFDEEVRNGCMEESIISEVLAMDAEDCWAGLLADDPDHARQQISKQYGKFVKQVFKACSHRAMFVTKKGYLGLAPWNAKVGDMVCVLDGGETPFLLRENPTGLEHTLVGETYVCGIMNGEALDMDRMQTSRRFFHIV